LYDIVILSKYCLAVCKMCIFYFIYSDLMEELLEYVDIENPIISVKYVNNDGSVITEKSFDKSILEKTTSDVNSSDEKSVQVKSCQLTTFYGW